MGREQRRKEAKKHKNHFNENKIVEESTFKASTTVKIIFAIVLILLVLYYILAVFVTKEIDVSGNKDSNTADTTDNNSSNVSDKILATATFRQSPSVYYVYYYDFDDEDEGIASAVSGITDKVYKVDTGDSLNKNYVTIESGNKNVTDISNLKVKSPTLIKIDNDKVVEYGEDKEEILGILNK